MITGFIYRIHIPKSNIIHLTTNTQYAEQQSQNGYKVTAYRYKVVGK